MQYLERMQPPAARQKHSTATDSSVAKSMGTVDIIWSQLRPYLFNDVQQSAGRFMADLAGESLASGYFQRSGSAMRSQRTARLTPGFLLRRPTDPHAAYHSEFTRYVVFEAARSRV